VWNPGKGSPIHDHADAHCIMKVLAGQLHETVYHAPDNKSGESKPLTVKSATTLGMNEVTYIADDIGLHRVHNPSSNQLAVSLHREFYLFPLYFQRVLTSLAVYTPPNAADYGYNIFDEATGCASHVSQAHSVPKPQ
jgi:cysteine dioxygenase